jgi:hypothetical protein
MVVPTQLGAANDSRSECRVSDAAGVPPDNHSGPLAFHQGCCCVRLLRLYGDPAGQDKNRLHSLKHRLSQAARLAL